ncbi:hypothetical protein H5410_023274 [Solanum commersonii]|uniref:Uncharacterized protein n=1 Tax=Solanum commersonii TaxID=4109 RepID=A0A9J5ZGD4_SOLCO|nr:hypothetical protein H5410_023274 [Solanum commersonii]
MKPTLRHSTRGTRLEEPRANKTPLSLREMALEVLLEEERAIWRRFIARKVWFYSIIGQAEEVAGTFGCSVRKTIRRLWPYLTTCQSLVGNGLAIYGMRNVSVSQAWSQRGWDLIFRRALNGREIGEIASLLGVLNFTSLYL